MKSYRDWIYVGEREPQPAGTRGSRSSAMNGSRGARCWSSMYTTNFQTAHTVSIDTTRALLDLQRYAQPGRGRAATPQACASSRSQTPRRRSSSCVVAAGRRHPCPDSQYVHDWRDRERALRQLGLRRHRARRSTSRIPHAPIHARAMALPGRLHAQLLARIASGRLALRHRRGERRAAQDLRSSPDVVTAQARQHDHLAIPRAIDPQRARARRRALPRELHRGHPRARPVRSRAPGRVRLGRLVARHLVARSTACGNVCPYFPSGTVIASDMRDRALRLPSGARTTASCACA